MALVTTNLGTLLVALRRLTRGPEGYRRQPHEMVVPAWVQLVWCRGLTPWKCQCLLAKDVLSGRPASEDRATTSAYRGVYFNCPDLMAPDHSVMSRFASSVEPT
jgi:hypothetical protein